MGIVLVVVMMMGVVVLVLVVMTTVTIYYIYIYIYTKNHIVNPNPFLVLGQSSFEFVVTCIPYLQRLMVVLRGGGVLGGYGSWSATLAVLSAEAVANNLCVVDAI